MAELSLRDVMVTYGGAPVLEHVHIAIEQGERIGLLGRNGAGKSTLLGVLAGKTIPDEGEVIARQGMRIASLVQDVPRELDGTVHEQILDALRDLDLPDWEAEKRADQAMATLSLDPSAAVAPLSAGNKRRVLLARAIAQEPDLLLLDEPTNHLDLEIIESLEEFLLRRDGALVFVTHDRRFLQRVATRILDVDRGAVRSFVCDYKTYLERKEALLEAEAKAHAEFDKKLAQEEVWVRRGVKARLTRNMGRVRALLAMREQRRARRVLSGPVRAEVAEAERSGQLVIAVEKLSHSFASPVIDNLTINIGRGDRIGIVGPNGCGKTTLLKLLLKELKPTKGTVKHGTQLEIAHFDQLHSVLDETKTLAENICGKGNTVTVGGKSKHVIGYLGDFLFSPAQVHGTVAQLSGGERNRLQLAKMLARPCNLLILDEPTNDLDLETLEILENVLVSYQGTLLIVSHDREFLDNVVTSLLVFEGNGRVQEYLGGYDDWMRVKEQQAQSAAAVAREAAAKKTDARPKASQGNAPKPRRLSYQEKLELEKLPGLIETLESKKEACARKMASPDFYKQPRQEIAATTAKHQTLQEELHAAYARWESLENLARDP